MTQLATKPLFLEALHCENHTGRPPVWLMRQAGRYLPEYRKMREKHDFLTMCHTPEIAHEVTLMPIKRFEMDAAILFSDILVIPEALDVGLHFDEGIGPIIDHPIKDPATLPSINIKEKLSFVKETILSLKQELTVPLIGFAGAPFTLASYMIEGKSSKTLAKTKEWMFKDPASFHKLLTLLTNYTIDYLNMQIEAGVDAIQLFDSWAHVLSSHHFKEFSLHYMNKILKGIHIPTILFCRGSSTFAPLMAEANPAAISIDWNGDLATIRETLPKNIALQGNLDPDLLLAPKEVLITETKRLLKNMSNDPGYIFNLGHGVTPKVPPENVQALVDTIKEYRA